MGAGQLVQGCAEARPGARAGRAAATARAPSVPPIRTDRPGGRAAAPPRCARSCEVQRTGCPVDVPLGPAVPGRLHCPQVRRGRPVRRCRRSARASGAPSRSCLAPGRARSRVPGRAGHRRPAPARAPAGGSHDRHARRQPYLLPGFIEGVPLVVEDVLGRPDTERAQLLEDPGFGRYFTDHVRARYRAGEGWVDARLRPTRRCRWTRARRRCTTPSRSSRGSRPTPSPTAASPPSGRRQRRPLRPQRHAAGHAAGARGGLHHRRRRAGRRRPRLGAHRPGPDPLHPPVHAGRRAVPRRPSGARVPVHRHRQPGRGVLPARRAAGLGLPLRGLHPGRARRHRRRQVRRQLRRQPAGPGAGRSPPAATRSSGSTRWRSATSRRWAG